MTRAIAFLGLALVAAAGCGKSSTPVADSGEMAIATGKPADVEVKTCIADYLAQCGWKDVQFASVVDQASLPPTAKTTGEAWAFGFTASYSNVFGERQTSENWVAVVARDGGVAKVTSCFDETKQLVAGHNGQEELSVVVMEVVAPKP